MSQKAPAFVTGVAIINPNGIPMWTIYNRPCDYPKGYIARKFWVTSKSTTPTEQTITGDLNFIRSELPPGLVCFHRDPNDEPDVVETWM